MASAPSMKRRQTLIGEHPIATAGEMLERYEPLDLIGHGSFGIIRKVKRKADGIILARKELNYRKMEERDLKQLNEEVMILQNMPTNDHIVRYYERFLDKTSQTLHIIMEFCEGGDLSHEISRRKDAGAYIPEDTVWLFLAQIASALSDCHAELDANGRRKTVVLHRDIKPENVFLSRDGQIKLGDFGLSKAMAAAAFTATYVGTPYYMSPELITGHPYDAKSDVWALGCLIHELCAFRPPFHQAQSQPELTEMIRNNPIPDIPRCYSRQLDQIVKAMLRQDARDRPTARQILTHDRVAFQITRLSLRKREIAMLAREQDLQLRELAVQKREQGCARIRQKEQELLERERALAEREHLLQVARDALEDEKERLTHALAGSSMGKRENVMSASSNSSSSGDSLFEDHEGNKLAGGSSGASSLNTDAEDVLRKVASRPSMVPRRNQLEERRSVGSLVRRMSSNSLMSVDETPSRYPGVIPPSPSHQRLSIAIPPAVTLNGSTSSAMASSKRRIQTSRSMYNLNQVKQSSASRQLFPSFSRDSLRAFAQAQDTALPPSPMRENMFADARAPHSSADAVLSEHSAPPSPVKRSAATAFASPTEAQVPNARPMGAPRTNTAPASLAPSPQYNLDDEDNLPSPFIKKKGTVRQASGRTAGRAAPPVPSRALRPSTSRLSLATKLAIGRTTRSQAQPSNDENAPPARRASAAFT